MTGVRVETRGNARYREAIQVGGSVRLRAAPTGRALKRIAFETQGKAQNKLRRGGSLAPAPSVLTSRTGTGRRAIGVDLASLPTSAATGSALGYMAGHETGGNFRVRAQRRRSRKGNVHRVRAHRRRVPKREWLRPAVDDIIPNRASAILVEEHERELARI